MVVRIVKQHRQLRDQAQDEVAQDRGTGLSGFFFDVIPVQVDLASVSLPNLQHCTIEQAGENLPHERHAALQKALDKHLKIDELRDEPPRTRLVVIYIGPDVLDCVR